MAADNQILVEIKGRSEQMVQAVEKASKKLDELAAATKRAETGWNGLLSKLGSFGMATEGIKNAGNALISMGKSLISTFVDFGAQLDLVSRRTGISIEALSQLKYAAEQSGVGFETLTDAIKAYNTTLGAAQLGNEGARKKLEDVGIDFAEYMGLDQKDQFLKLAEHISKIKNSAEQTRTTIELFGEAGYKLLPFFQQGEEGIKKLCEQADELGFTFHSKDAAQAAELSGKIAALKSSFEATGRTLIAGLVEPLTSLVEWLGEGARYVAKWIQDHPVIVKSFVYLAAGIAAAGTALAAFSVASAAFMATNPLGWALLGIGAVAGLTAALLTASEAVTGFEDDVKDADEKLKAMNATAGESQKVLDEFRQENTALDSLVDQIAAMCEKENLSNAEKEKMVELVRQLRQEFPGLSVEIDETSGKVENLTQKYLDLEKAAAQKRLGELKAKHAEYADKKLWAEVNRDFEEERIRKTFGKSLNGIGYKLTDSELSWDERQKIADESGFEDVRQAFAAYRKYAEEAEGWQKRMDETKATAQDVKEEATQNMQNYARKRASLALARVEADERAADEKNLNEFSKQKRAIQKEYDERIANLRAYKEELETLRDNGGLDEDQAKRLAGIDAEMDALDDEKLDKITALHEAYEQQQKDAEAAAAQQRADLLHNIQVLTGEVTEREKSAAEQKLEDLKAQNAEYLRQLELKKDITQQELDQAKAEAARREKALAEKLIQEEAAKVNPFQEAVDAAERELIEAQHDGGDVEGAQARLEAAKKNAEEASYQQALQDLKTANSNANRSRIAYNQAAKDKNTDPAELLRLQQKAAEDQKAAAAAMENFRKFAKPIDQKGAEEKPTERPFDTTIGSTTKGTFSIYGMGAAVDNTPAQQLDYLKKIYMLLGLFDREPAVKLV